MQCLIHHLTLSLFLSKKRDLHQSKRRLSKETNKSYVSNKKDPISLHLMIHATNLNRKSTLLIQVAPQDLKLDSKQVNTK